MKRSILIGSLGGPNIFWVRTTKIGARETKSSFRIGKTLAKFLFLTFVDQVSWLKLCFQEQQDKNS